MKRPSQVGNLSRPLPTLLFPLHGLADWNGGIDLARSLSTAILHPDVANRFTVHFAFPQPSISQRLFQASLRFWRLRLARGLGATAAGGPAALRAAALDIARGHDIVRSEATSRGIVSAAAQLEADIVFPTMFPLGKSKVRRVAYMFDFQHRHMPELFSERTRRNRDLRFARLSADADAVVVYAKETAKDAVRFFGVRDDRILTLPYAPHAHRWWFEQDPATTRLRYKINPNYLLVSNHFWKHKDHATALRAFALLRERHPRLDLQLVLTGDPVDHRDPRHYSDLVTLSESLGVTAQTHFLGLIPKRDQLSLLRGCIALLQPTLFEGGPGGGAVYEAIGLGVPAIVSDISVNLEIDQGDVRFFRTGDAADLAMRTSEAVSHPVPRPDVEALLAKGDVNLVRLGNAICDYLVNVPCR